MNAVIGVHCLQKSLPFSLYRQRIAIDRTQPTSHIGLLRHHHFSPAESRTNEHTWSSISAMIVQTSQPCIRTSLCLCSLQQRVAWLPLLWSWLKRCAIFAILIGVDLGCCNDIAKSDIAKYTCNTHEECDARGEELDGSLCLKCSTGSTQTDLCHGHTPSLVFATKATMMIDGSRWMNNLLWIFKIVKHSLVLYGQGCQDDHLAHWLYGR